MEYKIPVSTCHQWNFMEIQIIWGSGKYMLHTRFLFLLKLNVFNSFLLQSYSLPIDDVFIEVQLYNFFLVWSVEYKISWWVVDQQMSVFPTLLRRMLMGCVFSLMGCNHSIVLSSYFCFLLFRKATIFIACPFCAFVCLVPTWLRYLRALASPVISHMAAPWCQ